jgi:signal transduction histidine kinase
VLQIVLSLLSNAVKFSPPRAQVTITATADDSNVAISVTDEGKGIGRLDSGTIFDELQRGDDVGDAEGVGLGLYLSRVLADAQGGSITVDSTPGEGSCFTVTLPRAGVGRDGARRGLRRLRPLH